MEITELLTDWSIEMIDDQITKACLYPEGYSSEEESLRENTEELIEELIRIFKATKLWIMESEECGEVHILSWYKGEVYLHTVSKDGYTTTIDDIRPAADLEELNQVINNTDWLHTPIGLTLK